jgi:hypothetical protein
VPDLHRNFAYSTIATAPSPPTSGTSVVIAAGEGARFPTPPFNATIWPAGAQPLPANAEIVRVTAIATDTLTITRAQEGSTARAVGVGDQIAATVTAQTLRDYMPWKTRNLVIENDATNPAFQVRVTADEITVEDVLLATVNEVADITASGAGGLDTGAEASSTWYAIWLIYNPTTATVKAMLSTSFTAPTMPSGYTKKRRVGAIRNGAGSDFLKIVQRGDLCLYLEEGNSAPTLVLSAGSATTFTDVAMSAVVPTVSRRAWLTLILSIPSATVSLFVRPNGSALATPNTRVRCIANDILNSQMFVETDAAQVIEYKLGASVGGVANIEVLGYIDPVL